MLKDEIITISDQVEDLIDEVDDAENIDAEKKALIMAAFDDMVDSIDTILLLL